MNALPSPVEPLAFNYLSNGFFLTAVSNLWVWIASVALNFWTIGGASSSSSPPPSVSRSSEIRGWSEDDDAVSDASTLIERPGRPEADEPDDQVEVSAPSRHVLERDNSTKGKFVLYYGGAEDCDGEDGDAAALEKELDLWCCQDYFKGAMEVKMGDMGWYRCQDLSVFDGSVVRLLDGCTRRYGTKLAAAAAEDGDVSVVVRWSL